MFLHMSVILHTVHSEVSGQGRHPAPVMATAADGTHPTGMHSYFGCDWTDNTRSCSKREQIACAKNGKLHVVFLVLYFTDILHQNDQRMILQNPPLVYYSNIYLVWF